MYILWKMWSRKHGLDIFYNNYDDLCHHFNAKSIDGKDAYFTRLKVINNSKMTVNCRGHLRSIKDQNGGDRGSRWTNSELGWDRQIKVDSVNIGPSGDYKYLDIGWVNKDEDVFKVRTEQSLSQGIDTHRPRGQFTFR